LTRRSDSARAYYHVKRRLKYDVHPGLRDALLNQVFLAHGGDNPALADHLYMRWDEAQVMQAGGMELGGHTVTHAILSTLDAREQAAEIGGSVQAIAARLGQAPRVFAYPFGRKWDYNADSLRAVQAAGCELAVNTHSGTNTRASKPLELRRVPVEEGTSMALLLAEACGGFLLLERLGLSLSE
jgi:peptidoglycan/xylan/chitin deacetylase (PgdA/CDA1 family)